jgi:hypothetical protein
MIQESVLSNSVFRGATAARIGGPTLRSVRRIKNLTAALREINRRPVGIDGIPFEAFRDPIGHLRWNANFLDAYPDLNPLKTVQESLTKCSLPDAAQHFQIDGRNLERGTVANRIVERAITRILTATLNRFFSERSFGFRPGRSPETAILEVRRLVRDAAHWALKVDFEAFFDSIDRKVLENQLRETVADQTLCDAVMTVTSPAIIIRGTTVQRRNGLPQGNGLSPFLSNMYLHRFDEACSHLEYFRYADDVLVLGTSWGEVVEARRYIARLARTLGLRLSSRKTYVADLNTKPLVFLGYELRGGNIYPPERAIVGLRQKLELRGIGDRKALAKGFVYRYRIGPVRKLFRRLDRQLRHLHPPGVSLVSLLEANTHWVCGRRKGRKQQLESTGQLRRSHGQGCGLPDEKAVSGSPPRPAQPGTTMPNGIVVPALREP